MGVFGASVGKVVAESLRRVPLGVELREGGDVGEPVVLSPPDSAAGTALREVARTQAGPQPRRALPRPDPHLSVAPPTPRTALAGAPGMPPTPG